MITHSLLIQIESQLKSHKWACSCPWPVCSWYPCSQVEHAFSSLLLASVWVCDSLKEDPATSVVLQLYQFLFRFLLLVRFWRAKYLVVQSCTHHHSYLTKTPGGWHWSCEVPSWSSSWWSLPNPGSRSLCHTYTGRRRTWCASWGDCWSRIDTCWVPEGAVRRNWKLAVSHQPAGLTQYSLCTVESWSHSDYQGRMSLCSLCPYKDRKVSY